VTPCAAERLDEFRRLAARYGLGGELDRLLTLRPRAVVDGAGLRGIFEVRRTLGARLLA